MTSTENAQKGVDRVGYILEDWFGRRQADPRNHTKICFKKARRHPGGRQAKHTRHRTCVEERSRCRLGEWCAVLRGPPATGVPTAGEGTPRWEDCGVVT